VIALSSGAADALVRLYPAVKHKTRVIYNAGFDPAVVANARSSRPQVDPRRPVLVACGRLHVQKDYPTLLRALVLIRAEIPDARLWILGEGPERRELERIVHQLGLTDAVDFMGFQSNPHAYIAQADVFVLSSCWEGFGNVLVEAMVCEVPVVSTDCHYGPREIIEPEQSGLLTPVRDSAALSKAVLRILRHPALADRLRQAAKTRAQVFSADASVGAYEAIVRALITDRRDAPLKATAT
jgi:glycosyltransferase involved in cell wall biosynthesis